MLQESCASGLLLCLGNFIYIFDTLGRESPILQEKQLLCLLLPFLYTKPLLKGDLLFHKTQILFF